MTQTATRRRTTRTPAKSVTGRKARTSPPAGNPPVEAPASPTRARAATKARGQSRLQTAEESLKGQRHREAETFLVLRHLLHVEKSEDITVDEIIAQVAKAGVAVSRPSVVYALREMEVSGLGKFLAGRRGGVSRFQWNLYGLPAATSRTPRRQPREVELVGRSTAEQRPVYLSINLPAREAEVLVKSLAMAVK